MRVSKPSDSEPIRLVIDRATGQPERDRKGSLKYRAVLDVGTRGDGRRRQLTSTHPTLTAARDWVAQTRADVARGEYLAPESTTFDALADGWLASKAGVREVTRRGYRDVLKAPRAHLGSKRVQAIKRSDIDGLMAALAREGSRGKPLSHRSLSFSLTTVKAVLRFGVKGGLIRSNPADGVEIPSEAARRGDVTPWEPSELLKFRAVSDTHAWAAVWRIALSGLRRSEVLGLRWEAVDLDAGTVDVKEARVRLDGHSTTTGAPKAARSRRTVPVEALHPGTVALLRSLKAQQARDRLAAGSAHEDKGLVLVDALGRGITPDAYTFQFGQLCRASGVPVVRLHWLRHTVATILHRAGVEAADASAVLGHSTAVHLTYYVTSTQPGVNRAAKAFAAALAQAQ